MGGAWRSDYSERYVRELKALAPATRALFFQYMEAILADPLPLGAKRHVRVLPPPHMPGTMSATFGDHIVHYFIEPQDSDEDGGRSLVFLRLFTSRPGF